MKVIYGILFVHVSILEACLEKMPSIQIQNYEGPIYVSTPHKPSEHVSLLHQRKTSDSDCTCVSKAPKPCDYDAPKSEKPNNCETKVCFPYDVPKICDVPFKEVTKVCKQPINYEFPKVCTSFYFSDPKYDISNHYDQYFQQQNCFSNTEVCQKLGVLTDAKVKLLQVLPEGAFLDPSVCYGYKCDGDLCNYGYQGCGKTCLCKNCGGYITL